MPVVVVVVVVSQYAHVHAGSRVVAVVPPRHWPPASHYRPCTSPLLPHFVVSHSCASKALVICIILSCVCMNSLVYIHSTVLVGSLNYN